VTTIQEVARRAGVSTATVSRYLRGEPVRSQEAIRRTVQELGYSPRAAARSLRTGIAYAIAVVVPDVTNPFFAALVKGIESVFRPGPYSVFLANTDESSEVEEAVLADVGKRVDGIILVPATEEAATRSYVHETALPLVLVDRELPQDGYDSVLVDNYAGARTAARYLIGLGHSAIAMISGPLNTTPGRERFEGFSSELAEHGIEPPPAYMQVSDFREPGGYSAMLALLALTEPPTAVFCANNLMTVGALKALKAMRVQVPAKMSLIGFDDLDLAPLLKPPLTVIDRPTVKQGVLSARLLLSRLDRADGAEPQRIVLPTKLVERGSCSPPTASWSMKASSGAPGTPGGERPDRAPSRQRHRPEA
jgi:DNA-binding LacI/PurR family transcriptional regulator